MGVRSRAAFLPAAIAGSRVLILGCAAFVLSACASINGMQDRVSQSDLVSDKIVCPTSAERDHFNAMLDSTPKRDYRDGVITACMQIIQDKYDTFRSNLRSDSVMSNLVADVSAIGFNGAATLAHGKTAKQFSQAALAASGTGAAINTDVFFKQALPAIEAKMDENRADVLKDIAQKQKNDSNGSNYTLSQAGIDLLTLEAAGDIDTAIAKLTEQASAAASKATAEMKVAQAAAYDSVPLNTDVLQRARVVTDKIWSWAEDKDQKTLATLANKLGVTLSVGESFDDQRVDVLNAIGSKLGAPGVDQNKAVGEVEQAYSSSIQ